MFKIALAYTIALVAAVTTLPGCEEAKEAYDCNRICDRYQECFDEDYDVSACTDECRERGDEEAFDDQAESCQNCIDDRSCAGATFACASECSGIVP
jgi:hypothetical protein